MVVVRGFSIRGVFQVNNPANGEGLLYFTQLSQFSFYTENLFSSIKFSHSFANSTHKKNISHISMVITHGIRSMSAATALFTFQSLQPYVKTAFLLYHVCNVYKYATYSPGVSTSTSCCHYQKLRSQNILYIT